jgi:DNA-binding MltR family transcriptional regulator
MSRKKAVPDARGVLSQGLVDTLRADSDRAAAVLGVSVLDAQLEDLFRATLIHFTPKESFDGLFSANGPLATFSARINLAFSLGWISDDVRRDLHVLRDIRNTFAHSFDHAASFADDGIPDRLKALVSPAPLDDFALEALAGLPEEARQSYLATRSAPREKYVGAIVTLSMLLGAARGRAKVPATVHDKWERLGSYSVTVQAGGEPTTIWPPEAVAPHREAWR